MRFIFNGELWNVRDGVVERGRHDIEGILCGSLLPELHNGRVKEIIYLFYLFILFIYLFIFNSYNIIFHLFFTILPIDRMKVLVHSEIQKETDYIKRPK